jgi:hypothetical protein
MKEKTMSRSLIAALAALIAPPVLAHDATPFLYRDFEAAVVHIDLDECPDGLAEVEAICRITMNDDALHIFVFETEGDRPFLSVHTCFEEDFEIVLKK